MLHPTNPGGPQKVLDDGTITAAGRTRGRDVVAGPDVPLLSGAYLTVDPRTGWYEVGFNGFAAALKRTDSGWTVRDKKKKALPTASTTWDVDDNWLAGCIDPAVDAAPFDDTGQAQLRLIRWESTLLAVRGTVRESGTFTGSLKARAA